MQVLQKLNHPSSKINNHMQYLHVIDKKVSLKRTLNQLTIPSSSSANIYYGHSPIQTLNQLAIPLSLTFYTHY
jgi:hypothetical protein